MSDNFKLVGLTICRNEEWIIPISLEVALRWVDHLVVLDHASNDSTPNILQAFSDNYQNRVTLLREDDPTWMEMDNRQKTLEAGREVGGTHFAIIDCDEIVTANLLPQIKGWVKTLKPRQLMDLPMLGLWGGLNRYRYDKNGIWRKTWITCAFADDGRMRWKAKADGYQFHQRPPYGALTEPNERYMPVGHHLHGGVMHLQFANLRRFYAKQALYKMQEVIRWPDREPNITVERKYAVVASKNGLQVNPTDLKWWKGYKQELINMQNVPWHEEECRKLWEEYGPEKFRGLDLYGVVK